MAEKILIVDDDLETLRLVGMMLQGQGYVILAANNGDMAIEMVLNRQPDLVILDVMMPTIDGYEVAKRIKTNPASAAIPILIFTAKNQVQDKVIGYESGADDYLIKPIHPLELTAHIKTLLEKSNKPVDNPSPKKYFIIGIVAAKGGLGVSTLTLNLAIDLTTLTGKHVLAAEIRPGQGTWGLELDIAESYGLEKVLSLPLSKITGKSVEKHAVHTSFGPSLFMASDKLDTVADGEMEEKLSATVACLKDLADITILDIGTPLLPGWQKVCLLCDQLLVVTDSYPATVLRTRRILGSLQELISQPGSYMDIILYNHSRSDLQLSAEKVTKLLPGSPVRAMIPAVPEQVYQANQKFIPAIKVQADGLFAQQIRQLAEYLNVRMGG